MRARAVQPGRLVCVSNRLPVVRGAEGRVERASGGLVAAVEPVLARRHGVWVGWDGDVATPERVAGLPVDLDGVHLTRGELERYYHGLANSSLWPLLHGLVEHYHVAHRWWATYRDVNERFAERAAAHAEPGAMWWVHDYHLMLVPRAIAAAVPDATIAFFLHVPFPPPEVWARLPWSEQLLHGLLGASTIGFQTERFRDNFARSALIGGLATGWSGDRLTLAGGRTVQVRSDPISIDAAGLAERAASPSVARARARLKRDLGSQRVLLGVDRLDYTKGILERLGAFEVLLEQRPDLQGQVVLIQVAVPSRGDVREYRDARTAIEAAVGRVNGRFTRPGGPAPVRYSHASVALTELLALYQTAECCLVTSLNDGMNLVAKEYVVAQGAVQGSGSLVLSRFAGAAGELGTEALLCNPFHPEGIAGTIELALELPLAERQRRIRRMADQVARNDVFRWADRHLGAAARARVAV